MCVLKMTWTLSKASHVVIYFLEINLQNVVFQVQSLSFGFSKHVVRGIFRVAKWWHGVYEGWQHQSKPPCIVLGIYCLTCTVVFTNIALPLSNHLHCLKWKINNNISIFIMHQANTQYKKLQQVINVSELVSLKKTCGSTYKV